MSFLYAKIQHLVLALSYSPLASTIASTELNCRVRNENGCDLCDKAPKLKVGFCPNSIYSIVKVSLNYGMCRIFHSDILNFATKNLGQNWEFIPCNKIKYTLLLSRLIFKFPNRNRLISTP